MLKLLLMRHGESTGNREHRMSGHDDTGLTDHGAHQCRQLAHWLHQQNWQPSHIYSSPLRRATESLTWLLLPWRWQLDGPLPTAIAGQQPLRVTALSPTATRPLPQGWLTADLQEFNAGILTSLTWAEAQHRYPDLCQRLETAAVWVPIPGAETPLEGRGRAQRFIQQLLTQHHNGDAVWVMAHQWILEHLVAALLGCDRTWQITMPNTAVFEFWVDRDRWHHQGIDQTLSDLWQIKRFNGCEHFQDLYQDAPAIALTPPSENIISA